MRLVVDANVLVAAFLKEAVTRELLLEEKFELFSPEYLLQEIRSLLKNKKIRKRLKLNDEELIELATAVLSKIDFIPEEVFQRFFEKSLNLVTHPEDSPYVALALALKIPIWSNDAPLKEASASRIKVITTKELIKFYL